MRRLLLICLILLVGCAGSPAQPTSTQLAGTKLDGGPTLPAVKLTTATGDIYSVPDDIKTPAVVVTFGYTSCPDVCTGIAVDLASALNRLDPAEREKITVLYLSADPARDTPEKMREYLKRIEPSFVGLTGKQTLKVAQSLGIFVEKAKQLPNGYEVDHGTQIYGFGTKGEAKILWTQPVSVTDLRDGLRWLVESAEK